MTNEIEILLVEDDASDAEMIIRTLRKNNLAGNLLHVTDGAEALDFIFGEGEYFDRDIEHTPKVILLDLKMPKVNGKEVLQRLKSDLRTMKIPVVILTSSKEDPDIQECYRLGVNAYVVKPVEFDAFYKTISSLAVYWMTINQSAQ